MMRTAQALYVSWLMFLHLGRPASLHLRLHAGVRDHELAAVEHGVTYKAVEKLLYIGAELRSLLFELRQRAVDPVRNGDVASLKPALQLDIVIPGHAEGGTRPLTSTSRS